MLSYPREDQEDWNCRYNRQYELAVASLTGKPLAEDLIVDVWPAKKAPSQPTIYIATRGTLNELLTVITDNQSGRSLFGLSLRTLLPISDSVERMRVCKWRPQPPLDYNEAWVLIRGGQFDGDMGWVDRDLGGVWLNVTVVPRLKFATRAVPVESPEDNLNHNRKRPMSTSYQVEQTYLVPPSPGKRHLPSLLPSDVKERLTPLNGIDLKFVSPSSMQFEETSSLLFAWDMLVIRVRRKHVTLALVSPPHLHSHLSKSQHPQIVAARSHLPPLEHWTLESGALVEDLISGIRGTVVSDGPDRAFLISPSKDPSNKQLVTQDHLLRVFEFGDFVGIKSTDGEIAHGWVIDTSPPAAELSPTDRGTLSPEELRKEEDFYILGSGQPRYLSLLLHSFDKEDRMTPRVRRTFLVCLAFTDTTDRLYVFIRTIVSLWSSSVVRGLRQTRQTSLFQPTKYLRRGRPHQTRRVHLNSACGSFANLGT